MALRQESLVCELSATADADVVVMTTVCGTGKYGRPACATVLLLNRKLVER
jgi:hypothetical protein